MASAASSSSRRRSPACRFRNPCCRSCSRTTRRPRTTPTASTWTIHSSCPPPSRRSASDKASRRLSSDPIQGPLQYLKGVGPRRAADLRRAGLETVEDLLYRFPTRYEDRGHFQTIASLRPGVAASVAGEVLSCGIRPTRRPRFRIFEMLVRDQTGTLRAIWFNQPFLNDVFHPHQRVILFGKLELTSHGLQMQSPEYEVLRQESDAAGEGSDDDTLHTGRIVPVYEKTGTLTTKMQRVLVHEALAQLPATLPDPIPAAVLE